MKSPSFLFSDQVVKSLEILSREHTLGSPAKTYYNSPPSSYTPQYGVLARVVRTVLAGYLQYGRNRCSVTVQDMADLPRNNIRDWKTPDFIPFQLHSG